MLKRSKLNCYDRIVFGQIEFETEFLSASSLNDMKLALNRKQDSFQDCFMRA